MKIAINVHGEDPCSSKDRSKCIVTYGSEDFHIKLNAQTHNVNFSSTNVAYLKYPVLEGGILSLRRVSC